MKKLVVVLLLFTAGCKKPATVPAPVGIAGTVASIDLGNEQQVIRGFGGCTAWLGAFTDAEMNTLYGNDSSDQFGLSILRIRIDPTGSSKWGDELSNAKKALSRGAIVMASPWSPPAAMKSNNNILNGGKLNRASYADYSAYLASFAAYMANNSAPLYALSVQNEPEISETYESCVWAPADLLYFIKNYPPAIGSTKLMASESYHFDHAYTDTILNDAVASANVGIVGGHIYGAGLAPYPLAVDKGKEVWMTERLDMAVTFDSVLNTALEIHDCLTIGNYDAYVWWWIKKSWGLIDENSVPTKRGYMMGQFSKYIRPGYTRVGVQDYVGNGIYLSAYKSGSSVVVVAINIGTSVVDQPFTITGGNAPVFFTPHITSDSLNISTEPKLVVWAGAFSYPLLPKSVTTFVSN